MKNVAIHLPVWKRKRCQLMAYDTLDRLRAVLLDLGYDSYVVVGGSNRVDKGIAEEKGHKFLMLPNKPVGRKFHEISRYIYKQHNFDIFMEFCSDNCVTSDYLRKAVQAIEDGYDMACSDAFQTTSWTTRKCYWFTGGNSNVARLTPYSVVDFFMRKHNFIYDLRKNRRLDHSFAARLRRKNMKIKKVEWDAYPPIVDVKDEFSMNPLESYKKRDGSNLVPLTGDFPEFYNHHPLWPLQEK